MFCFFYLCVFGKLISMSPLPTKKRLLTEDDLIAAIGDAINLSAYYQKWDFVEGPGILYSRQDDKLIISVNEATMPAGKSAYELWQNLGNGGKSLQEFFDSLKGAKGDIGETGATGKSAYQSWLDLNPTGSVEDFLLSLKGTNGTNGQDGQQGQQGLQGPVGPAGQAGPTGADGKSAYQLWLDADPNNIATLQEYLASLKGDKGDPGTGSDVDLSDYYNRTEVDDLISGIPSGGSCSCGQGVQFYTEQEIINMLIRTGFREGTEVNVPDEPENTGDCTCGTALEFYTEQEMIEMLTSVGFREAV
jgi:hypothetical protein